MKIDNFGFYFEKQGRSGEEGPIDPAQQYFEGSHADHAVVRETIQNTLDNPGENSEGPIRMEFELATMRTEDIPGIEKLREHMNAVAAQTEKQQGHERMLRSADLAMQDEIHVLRISDYNTTGLTGSEVIAAKGSPLSRLTRGKGGSNDDERGGSFGIGSAAGPSASELCTVFYTSVPEDTGASVMAGYTRLATHELEGTSYRAEGYFTRLDIEDDFEYFRPAQKFGPFPERSQTGTDIYILGYRMADSDPELERVRDAVIDNFMAAIDRGRLIVDGIAQGNRWTLNAETLGGFAQRRHEAHAFYVALRDSEPAEGIVKNVGKVKLYVNIDDRLDRKLHTITMRSPLMKIDTFKHNSISAKYAAVLICETPEGNKYLRGLEPPQHHCWDAARDPVNGKSVIDNLKVFVRNALKERVAEEIGDIVEINGLSRFLPTDTVSDTKSGFPAAPTSEPDATGTDTESSTVTGNTTTSRPSVTPGGKKVRVMVRPSATSGGDNDTDRGKDGGGGGKRQQKGGEISGTGEDGDGTSRIRGRELSFRSWSAQNADVETDVIALAITANKDETGDLKLAALGPGGDPENDYMLSISRAVIYINGEMSEVQVSGNTLKDLSLKEGQMTRIDVHVPAGERYRLGAV